LFYFDITTVKLKEKQKFNLRQFDQTFSIIDLGGAAFLSFLVPENRAFAS